MSSTARLEFDQCAALNALGGPCAVGAILSAVTTKAVVQGAFGDAHNLYFFYAAENKDKAAHLDLWKAELVAQRARAESTGAAGASAFVHVIDEAHVGDAWRDFRAAFSDFQEFLSSAPPHHMVRYGHLRDALFVPSPHAKFSSAVHVRHAARSTAKGVRVFVVSHRPSRL
jgi:hypothetical protein